MQCKETVVVTDKAVRSLRNGHPWIYEAEVMELRDVPDDGGLVQVQSKAGKWLGVGFYNSNSKIRVRILTRNPNDTIDRSFWIRRLNYAVAYRRVVMGDDFSNCRLIFGEADGFPGLTVDRFGHVLVAQILCLGIEYIKEDILGSLVSILRESGEQIEAVYERNDVKLREKEGMEQGKGFLELPGLKTDLDGHVEIIENGVHYDVDYINGQKTGFFLDQKYNRAAIARLAKGKRVLDCFTHTGAFGLNCALAEAEQVVSVDVSELALEQAKHNAELTGVQNVKYVQRDVFDLLTELADGKRGQYDLVILDPPAFTKSSATVSSAIRGYKEINLKAMRILPRGGYLATCSCSHFMTDERFRVMLADAAKDAQVQLRQIEARQQGPDHPILWNVPETDYLKFYIFQIV